MTPLIKACIAALMLTISPVYAQDDSNDEPDPVFVFNRICFSQVHDINAIEAMSIEQLWKRLNNDVLGDLKTVETPDVLMGWDVRIGDRIFRVAVNQSSPTEQMLTDFPDFAGGTVTSCSLVLDDFFPADVVLNNMQTLAGKTPISTNVPEGALSTTTWAGGNDDLKVFLFAKVNPDVGGGLLHVTLLQK